MYIVLELGGIQEEYQGQIVTPEGGEKATQIEGYWKGNPEKIPSYSQTEEEKIV